PPAASAPAVGAYAVHLPPFWAQHPEVWFLQAEGSFRLANITSQEVRFSHIQASLPCEIALEVYDILSRPPAANPYDALKAAILERTMLSERKRLQQLVSAEELGDRRPSQLLRQMQALLGERAATFDSQFLKELFLQRLPPSVQMILATASDLSLPALALHADKIMEVANQHPATPTVSSVQRSEPATQVFHAPAAPADARNEIAALRQDVQHLQELVTNTLRLSRPHSPRRPSQSRSSRRRSSSPHANRQPRPNQPRQEQQHCWYHQRFGATAERCTRPCSWSENETRDR
ncbi:unnamed protein product, partial [Ixodes hexagonus]